MEQFYTFFSCSFGFGEKGSLFIPSTYSPIHPPTNSLIQLISTDYDVIRSFVNEFAYSLLRIPFTLLLIVWCQIRSRISPFCGFFFFLDQVGGAAVCAYE